MSQLEFKTDVDHTGKLKYQRVASLPVHAGSDDKGRIVYDESVNISYIGTDTEWQEILTRVQITSPTDGQVLTYNEILDKWINADPNGGGFGEYVDLVSADLPLSHTSVVADATYTYSKAALVGVDLDTSKVAGLYITFTASVRYLAVPTYVNLYYTYPDGSEHKLSGLYKETPEDDYDRVSTTYLLPVSADQTDIVLRLEMGGNVYQVDELTLIGVLINSFGGSGSGGSSSNPGGSSLIAYGEITDLGQPGSGTSGALTVTGDLSSATKTNLANSSQIDVVFASNLLSTSYNVMYEIISLDGDDSDTNATVCMTMDGTKTVSGFSFLIGRDDSATSINVQVNIRIESNIPTSPDISYIEITATNGATALSQTLTGTYTYSLIDFVGSNYNSTRVRGVYINTNTAASIGQCYIYGTFPDGNEYPIQTSKATGGGDSVASSTIYLLPVNPGQTEIELRIAEGSDVVDYNIVGVAQILTSSILEANEYLLIKGTTATRTVSYITTSDSVRAAPHNYVWTSEDVTSSTNWNSILPISIPTSYNKTRLKGIGYNTDGGGGATDEDTCEIDILIDWSSNTVRGSWHVCCGASFSYQSGGIFSGSTNSTIVATNTTIFGTFFIGSSSTKPLTIQTGSRTIVTLPMNYVFCNVKYEITNYN